METQMADAKLSSAPAPLNGFERKSIFITGGTGYIGTRLIKRLLTKGYDVIGLVRKGSERKLPAGANAFVADPFDANSFAQAVPPDSIFIQLLGVSHPSPKKARLFEEVDWKSVKASADAAKQACVSKFIYVSVAMAPGNFMKAYQDVRKKGEQYCLSQELNCSFIRPWYVLGPGHWWPILLMPLYGISELFPRLRKKARSRALVTIHQMLRTLACAVEKPAAPLTVFEIKNIRAS